LPLPAGVRREDPRAEPRRAGGGALEVAAAGEPRAAGALEPAGAEGHDEAARGVPGRARPEPREGEGAGGQGEARRGGLREPRGGRGAAARARARERGLPMKAVKFVALAALLAAMLGFFVVRACMTKVGPTQVGVRVINYDMPGVKKGVEPKDYGPGWGWDV